jgi:hypothetical protein
MRRILPAVLLFSGVAMADGASKPPPIPAGARVAWSITVSTSGETRWFTPGKGPVQLVASAPWTCTMRPLDPGGTSMKLTVERVIVDCVTKDAEVSFEQGCLRRNQPRSDVMGEPQWRMGETQYHRLASKGQAQSSFSIGMRCDVNTRFEP